LPVSGRKPGAARKAKAAILSYIRRALCEEFPDLLISIPTLHRYLVQKCRLTFKKLEKLPAARNSDRELRLRREKLKIGKRLLS
jgi:hypothetical protein